jgi:hypothetical protein
MAFANSAISDIIATTIQNRSGELADNVTNNNALLRRLKERGNSRPFGGGNVIFEEIMYADASTNVTNSYSGYEAINMSPNSPISRRQLRHLPVRLGGDDERPRNAAEQQQGGRSSICSTRAWTSPKRSCMNRIGGDVYLDGTGNGGKNITGLAAAVPDAPTSGHLRRHRSRHLDLLAPPEVQRRDRWRRGGLGGQHHRLHDRPRLRLVRGNDKPDLAVADNTYFGLYAKSLQAIQRVTDETKAGAGFASR